jgi:hypothetical protein
MSSAVGAATSEPAPLPIAPVPNIQLPRWPPTMTAQSFRMGWVRRVRVPCERSDGARYVDDASRRRVPDALCRGCDGALIRDLGLEDKGASAPTLAAVFPCSSDPMRTVKPWGREAFAI